MNAILLALATGLKFGQLATTGGTMLLSLVTYSYVWGWRYAAGFVTMLLVHELGHYLMARHKGVEVGAPTFIPFVGAWIELRQIDLDAETEADIAIAGPYLGTIAALVVYLAWDRTGEQIYLAIAYGGLVLNLFNLLPVSPLDGGRITGILSPKIWFLGAPLLVVALVMWPSPALALVVVAAVPQLLAAWRSNAGTSDTPHRRVPMHVRIEYGLLYIGLTGFLAVATYLVHLKLSGLS